MYWRLENYLSSVSKRLANHCILAGASSLKSFTFLRELTAFMFKAKTTPSPLTYFLRINQTGRCPAVPGLLSTMAHEENIALRQRYELLKGAEHHKNALIEARYRGPSSPNASDLTV